MKITTSSILSIGILLLTAFTANAQQDTIFFDDTNVLVGEVKSMSRGVLVVETDYSDSDFTIDWQKVKRFKSDQYFSLALQDRSVMHNVQISTISDGKIVISGEGGGRIVSTEDIVFLRTLDDSFFSRLSASIDLGWSLAKANNLRQFNTRSALGYTTDAWILSATYNQVYSTQSDTDPTKRLDASLGANRELKHSFFLGAKISFLSNTEQLIDLRTTGQLGGGYYIARTNDMYWNGFVGFAFNNENFIENPETPDVTEDQLSYEGVIGTELNLYDIGDFNLLTNVTWYPSITETGRNRVDLKLDVSYDLPFDFYIKSGVSLNYDSQPTPGASTNDYVFQTGFGWSL